MLNYNIIQFIAVFVSNLICFVVHQILDLPLVIPQTSVNYSQRFVDHTHTLRPKYCRRRNTTENVQTCGACK